jgi:hypothetical protein
LLQWQVLFVICGLIERGKETNMNNEAQKFNAEHFTLELWDKQNKRWHKTRDIFYSEEKAVWYRDYLQDFCNAPMRVCRCLPV